MRLRELASALCLAPVVLIGSLSPTNLIGSHKTQGLPGAAILEVQTCDTGLGLDAKAGTNGLYGADIQYGFTFEPARPFRVSFIPKLGVSYADHPILEVPQRTQFGLGAQILLGYEDFRIGLEWWHLSNGSGLGLNVSDRPNYGLNLIALQTGWVF